MQPPNLRTERLMLRKPDASDLGPYTAYCQSDRTRFVGGPFNSPQAFDKLAAMIGHWDLRGFGRYVIVHRATGRALGHVGAMQLQGEDPPELTWTLWAAADEGQGYATEAAIAYRDHARDDLGFPFMIARILPNNLPSCRLAARLGGIRNDKTPPPAWMPHVLTYDFTL